MGFGGEKVSCPCVESVSSAALRVAPLPSVPGAPGLLYPPGQARTEGERPAGRPRKRTPRRGRNGFGRRQAQIEVCHEIL
ncbi:hypothetical protein BEI60_20410 [Eisenbergiella tayi]|nr:hypothetical protein BEI60_20410 [Eisenbergiella tayi]